MSFTHLLLHHCDKDVRQKEQRSAVWFRSEVYLEIYWVNLILICDCHCCKDHFVNKVFLKLRRQLWLHSFGFFLVDFVPLDSLKEAEPSVSSSWSQFTQDLEDFQSVFCLSVWTSVVPPERVCGSRVRSAGGAQTSQVQSTGSNTVTGNRCVQICKNRFHTAEGEFVRLYLSIYESMNQLTLYTSTKITNIKLMTRWW